MKKTLCALIAATTLFVSCDNQPPQKKSDWCVHYFDGVTQYRLEDVNNDSIVDRVTQIDRAWEFLAPELNQPTNQHASKTYIMTPTLRSNATQLKKAIEDFAYQTRKVRYDTDHPAK